MGYTYKTTFIYISNTIKTTKVKQSILLQVLVKDTLQTEAKQH